MLHHLWFRLKCYLNYRKKAVGAHALHSPFLFSLYNEVIVPARKFRLANVEKLRRSLQGNHQLIDIYDLKTGENFRKPISSIAKTSLSSPKFSAFLYLLIHHLKLEHVLETGTSLGINALYMAGADQVKKVTTIEVSPIIAAIAQEQFSKVLQNKITIKQGTIQEVFESTLIQQQPALCFIDADHRSEAVRFCVENIMKHCPHIQCIILHDIYWSEDMRNAWCRMVNDARFNLTVDLFEAGIIFPHIHLPKQHFTLRF